MSDEKEEISEAIKDAYDRLKAGIAMLEASNTQVPIELHKAAHALGYAVRDLGAGVSNDVN